MQFFDDWTIPRDIMAVFLVFGARQKILVCKITEFLGVVSVEISFVIRYRVLCFIFLTNILVTSELDLLALNLSQNGPLKYLQ